MLITYSLLAFFIIAGGLATCSIREARMPFLQPLLQKVPADRSPYPARR